MCFKLLCKPIFILVRQKISRSSTLHWLVVWNMNCMTFHILGIIPADFHIFQSGWNHQPVKHSPFVLRVQAEVDFDWAQAVSDFRDRLRGDLTTEDLGPWGALGNP